MRLFRDVGNVTMDINSFESIHLAALGGADNIAVHDLSGTGVKQVTIDLASPPGSGMGDGAADSVTVDATAKNDRINIQGSGANVTVTGTPAAVSIDGAT